MDKQALNDGIHNVMDLVSCERKTMRAFDKAVQLHELIADGNKFHELLISGSSAEETELPSKVMIPEREKEACSDFDLMYVLKFKAGSLSGLIDALCLEHYESSLKRKAATMHYYLCDLANKRKVSMEYRLYIIFTYFYPNKILNLDRYNEIEKLTYGTSLPINDTECHHGYLRLNYGSEYEYLNETIENISDPCTLYCKCFIQVPTLKDGKPFLSSSAVLDSFRKIVYSEHKKKPDEPLNDFRSHGPAVETEPDVYDQTELTHSYIDNSKHRYKTGNIDMVPAIRCPYWPASAFRMLFRKCASGRPLLEQRIKIFLMGCLIVPTAHTLSETPAIEWRYSFSECEKELCNSWNTTQVCCYQLLKLLKHNYFKDLGISSYHLKTVVYWAIEKFDERFWTRKNLVKSIEEVLRMLLLYLFEKNLPNYFISENNMVDDLTSDNINIVTTQLMRVLKDVPSHIISVFNPTCKAITFHSQVNYNHYKECKELKKFIMKKYKTDVKYLGHIWIKLRSFAIFNYNNNSDEECINVTTLNTRNFELYLKRMRSMEQDFFTLRYLKMAKASHAHIYSNLYLLTKSKIYFARAESLFKSSKYLGPLIGQILLVHFYVVHEDFSKASHMFQSIPPETMELKYEQFKFTMTDTECETKQDIDVLLQPHEMQLYRMHERKFTIQSDIKMWRFHCRAFAKYLCINIHFRLNRLQDGYQNMIEFDSFINKMKENDIDIEYVRTSKYLSMLNWNLFYACIVGKLSF